ncbi:MAG: sulfotransferase [Chloroflexi bacterium]|nr:sulfotransferase [Chloroflexota bacterium]MCI0725290.1 sulfotransferase [Chloroflexota bacterium]
MIQRPILIIGCPRSGTTLLYSILSEIPELWSIGAESREIIEEWHHPRHKHWESGVLDASDLTAESEAGILSAFERQAAPGTFWRRVNAFRAWLRHHHFWREVKRRGRTQEAGAGASSILPQQGLALVRRLVRLRSLLILYPKNQPFRLLEKTPENCLRLPFLLALFPDARIIYLVRDGRANVSSLMEGWQHPHLFHGYRPPVPLSIPGNGQPDKWAFTLIPGWRDLINAPLEEVCAWQWIRCNEAVLAHQEQTQGQVPYLTLRYEELVARPAAVLPQIASFIGVEFDQNLNRYAQHLPQINVVSTPQQEKWRRENPEAIERILPLIRPTMDRLGYESNQ